MLNRILLIIVLIYGYSVNAAHAIGGTINFTGNLLESTCQITSGDEKQTVAMGDFQISGFNGQSGIFQGNQSVTIRLENCGPGLTGARVVFDGVRDPLYANAFKLDGVTGAGLALFEDDGSTLITPGTASRVKAISAQRATLNFKAKYRSSSATVTPGSANAAVDFTIQYQ
ncbi:fimbrial protein [Pantoea sp.]|uniref:fimbrial protein n=1 Tax=Pantoea sp. TaxID=69393 RepID=UPI0031D3A1D2